jgi:hypothetical protein
MKGNSHSLNKVPFWNLLRENEEITKNFSQDSQCPSRHLKLVPHKCGSRESPDYQLSWFPSPS